VSIEGVFAGLFREVAESDLCLADDHYAGGVAVEAVYDGE
jgi:hypothetical protein